MNMKQFNICEAFRGLDDIDDSIVTEVIKTEKPTVVFTCNVKTLNEGLELKEAFSPSMPDWLKKRLIKDRNTAAVLSKQHASDYSKLQLGADSIDLEHAEFISAPVPVSHNSKYLKLDAWFFFLLKNDRDDHDYDNDVYNNVGEQVYIKGFDDEKDFVLIRQTRKNQYGYEARPFKTTAIDTILRYAVAFCYVLKKPENITNQKQFDRATARQGAAALERKPEYGSNIIKPGQYAAAGRKAIYMNGPNKGKSASWTTVQPGELVAQQSDSSYDNSGFRHRFDDLKRKLTDMKGKTPYEALKKIYEKLAVIKGLIADAYSRLDIDLDNYSIDSVFQDLIGKACGRSNVKNGEEALEAFSSEFKKELDYYRNILDNVNYTTKDTTLTDEQKEKAYIRAFGRYSSDYHNFSEFNARTNALTQALRKFNDKFLKDVSMDEFEVEEKLEKKELKEALAVDLRDEKAIEEGKEFKDKSDDQEVIETVIDLDAEDENELKSKSHAGDLLFKCTTCGKDIYRTVEDFQVAEKQDDGTYKLKSLDNREEFLSCPECQNQFFRLDGKVTPMAEVGVEEPKEDKGAEMDWDLGDVSDEETPAEEPAAEEAPVEDIGNIEVDLPEENFEEDLELPEEDFEDEEEEDEEKEELHDSLDLGREIEHYLKEHYEGIEGFKVTNITESLVEGTLIMANPYSEEAVTFNYKKDRLFEGCNNIEVSGEVLDESFSITERK